MTGPAAGGTGGAVVAVLGAKGAPGATTSALALALGWPRPVLVIDADLAGGDIAAGWLAGRVGLDRGLLSFAAATRHAETAAPADLVPHVVTVPDAPGVMVLPGVAHGGQARGLDNRLWARLLVAAASPWPATDSTADRGPHSAGRADAGRVRARRAGAGREQGGGAWLTRVDVLVDVGRIGAGTPWPLVAAASVVLLVTRPTLRGVHHARHTLAAVEAAVPGLVGDSGRVGLLVCGPGAYDSGEVGRAVGLPVRVVLPADGRAADALADGASGGAGFRTSVGRGWSRTLLARAARAAIQPLASLTDGAGGAPLATPATHLSAGREGRR